MFLDCHEGVKSSVCCLSENDRCDEAQCSPQHYQMRQVEEFILSYVSVRICGDMEDSEMVVVSNNLVLVFSQEGNRKMTTTTATEWTLTGSLQGKLNKKKGSRRD